MFCNICNANMCRDSMTGNWICPNVIFHTFSYKK